MRLSVLFSMLLSLSGFALQAQQTYTNPILAGFYPDPSICRAGDDYYIVTSTFAYYPGLPIFHSKDLVSWKLIGHAMDRPSQLDLSGAGVSRGLFAPAISYYKGKFYIVCTLIDRGGNFIITADNPAGPWSEPVYIKEVNGIDPSIYFDEKADRAYLVYNSVAPNNKPLWDGHRSIRMYELDYKNLKLTGIEKLLVDGGVDVSKKPRWIEAPHIYFINDWYYLMCAEGGTEYNHSEVVFRSKSIEGPYVPWEKNPILTQRQLDKSRPNPITTAGHADLVQTQTGSWYAVFLACRPYQDDLYNIGRETFLAPVTWTSDGWPVITKDNELIQYKYPLPLPGVKSNSSDATPINTSAGNSNVVNPKAANSKPGNPGPINAFSGNFTFHDDFDSEDLNKRFFFLRTVTDKWYNTTDKKGQLSIQLRPETVSGKANPSFVAFRQQHHRATLTTKMSFAASAENEKAGLLIFQNEQRYYYICKSVMNGKPVIQLYQSSADSMKLLSTATINSSSNDCYLRIEPKDGIYIMSYSLDGKSWKQMADVDGTILSTGKAGGFVGCVMGPYATSLGKPSQAKAYFDWFDYKGNDAVFK